MKNPEIRFIDDNIDWKKHNIKNSCKISTGYCVTDKDTSDNYEYPVISGGKEPMGYYLKFNRNANTITIARAGTAGFVNFLETPFWLNDKCFSIEPYSNNIFPKFLYFVLKEMELKIMEMKGSSSVPTINTQHVGSINVQLPSLNIQKEIATLISDIDVKINNQNYIIQKLKDAKFALLIKMFPQENQSIPELRFDGFTNTWEQCKLSNITFLAGERNRNNLPYESYSINNEQGFVPQNEQFEKGGSMATADKTLYNIVSPKSFAYNPARINVGSIGYYDDSKNVIVSSLYEVFKTTEDINDRFLWHWFKTNQFQKMIEKYQEGGVRLYFYYDKLCMCSLKVPHIEEQNKIASTLDNLDNAITLHQHKSFHLNFSL